MNYLRSVIVLCLNNRSFSVISPPLFVLVYLADFCCFSSLVLNKFGKMNLFNLPNTEEEAITFFQAHGILPGKRFCSDGHEMTLCVGQQVRWRCKKRSCRTEVNMRVGNWLVGMRLSYVSILRFVYGWAWQYTSISWCERELGINHNTTVSMNAIMRETCALYMIGRSDHKIGGHGRIVEVDES